VAGTSAGAGTEPVVLFSVFLSVIGIGDGLWALIAASIRHWIRRFGALHNRLTGGAGVALALSRRTI
jgi:threonine/homoserine/homoserine lactone efflux protein